MELLCGRTRRQRRPSIPVIVDELGPQRDTRAEELIASFTETHLCSTSEIGHLAIQVLDVIFPRPLEVIEFTDKLLILECLERHHWRRLLPFAVWFLGIIVDFGFPVETVEEFMGGLPNFTTLLRIEESFVVDFVDDHLEAEVVGFFHIVVPVNCTLEEAFHEFNTLGEKLRGVEETSSH